MQSQYKVMKNPAGKLNAVKIGFNWVVFFSVPWLATIFFAFMFGMNTHGGFADAVGVSLVAGSVTGVPLGTFSGHFWNKFKFWNMLRCHYSEVGVITAGNIDSALALYINSAKDGSGQIQKNS